MAKKITLNIFSMSSIQAAKEELEKYRDSLAGKCELLCQRLCQEGLMAANAQMSGSGLSKYVLVTSEITPEAAGCKAVLYMEDTHTIVSQWENLEGVQTRNMSPTLLIEFGAGLKASNPLGIPGMGTGSYGEHGNQSEWWYMDLDGNWHRATGTEAKLPMYFASRAMRERVITIAKEVFG